jgi:hypothetical protein
VINLFKNNVDPSNEKEYPALHKWMLEKMERYKKVFAKWNHEQSKKLIADVTEIGLRSDPGQARSVCPWGMRRPDQSSPARNQGQGGAAGQSEAGICSPK